MARSHRRCLIGSDDVSVLGDLRRCLLLVAETIDIPLDADVLVVTGSRHLSGCALRGTAGESPPQRGTAGAASHGRQVTIFGLRLVDDEMCPSVELDLGAARFSAVYEQYSIGHRAGLDIARRLGVPFVLEMGAPLSLDSRTFRNEHVSVADCVIEDELLAASDLVITSSEELMHWASRRRHGPTIARSMPQAEDDQLASMAAVAGADR